jgi:hypothetical protein
MTREELREEHENNNRMNTGIIAGHGKNYGKNTGIITE